MPVSTEPPPLEDNALAAPANLRATTSAPVSGDTSVQLSWTPTGPEPDRWVVGLNGVNLGTVQGGEHTVTVTEVDATRANELSVAAVAADGLMGEKATMSLAGLIDPTAPDVEVTPATRTGEAEVAWAPVVYGATYDVRTATARFDGSFTEWSLLTGASGVFDERLASPPAIEPGWTRCFQVRATAHGGRKSPWSAPACTARPLDDQTFTRVGWETATGSEYYQGTVSRKQLPAAVMSYGTIQSARIGLLVGQCEECGSLDVTAGRYGLGSVDLSDTQVRGRSVLVWLPYQDFGSGLLTLTTTSPAGAVAVDGVVIKRSPPP